MTRRFTILLLAAFISSTFAKPIGYDRYELAPFPLNSTSTIVSTSLSLGSSTRRDLSEPESTPGLWAADEQLQSSTHGRTVEIAGGVPSLTAIQPMVPTVIFSTGLPVTFQDLEGNPIATQLGSVVEITTYIPAAIPPNTAVVPSTTSIEAGPSPTAFSYVTSEPTLSTVLPDIDLAGTARAESETTVQGSASLSSVQASAIFSEQSSRAVETQDSLQASAVPSELLVISSVSSLQISLPAGVVYSTATMFTTVYASGISSDSVAGPSSSLVQAPAVALSTLTLYTTVQPQVPTATATLPPSGNATAFDSLIKSQFTEVATPTVPVEAPQPTFQPTSELSTTSTISESEYQAKSTQEQSQIPGITIVPIDVSCAATVTVTETIVSTETVTATAS